MIIQSINKRVRRSALLGLLFLLLFSGCAYDNYDPPQLTLSGQLQYDGQPFPFDGYAEGEGLSKIIQFYQEGFGKSGVPVSASVGADGSFTQLVFPGEYLATIRNTPYPFTFDDWAKTESGAYDTVRMEINSDHNLLIPVTPYFTIEDVTIEVSGTNLVARFKIKRIQEGANVVRAKLFVGTSAIVNSATPASAEMEISDISEPISLSFSIPNYRTRYVNNFRSYAFVRIALETDQSPSYFLWSPVHRIDGLPLEFNEVSEQYLENYKQPFEISEWLNDRRGIVTGWQATDEIKGSMFDGWGDRLFMSAENWGGPTTLTGAVWQTMTLPAGKYIFMARRGWNNGDLGGRTDRAFLVAAKGSTLATSGDDVIGLADCGMPQHSSSLGVEINLASEQTISVGYAVNFPAGETNAVSFVSFSLLKVD